MVHAQLCSEWPLLRYWSPVQIFCYHRINSLRQNLCSNTPLLFRRRGGGGIFPKRKQRAYKNAKLSNQESDWNYYKKLKTQLQCRRAYHEYVEDMGRNFDDNPRTFWRFVQGKRCENNGVAPLKDNGIICSDSKLKAEILNKQFTSIFTKEDTSYLPDLGPSPYPKLPDIIIDCEGILKLLRDLKPHKAAGLTISQPDCLKIMHVSLHPAWYWFSKFPLPKARFQPIGSLDMLRQFSRREIDTKHPTTGLSLLHRSLAN